MMACRSQFTTEHVSTCIAGAYCRFQEQLMQIVHCIIDIATGACTLGLGSVPVVDVLASCSSSTHCAKAHHLVCSNGFQCSYSFLKVSRLDNWINKIVPPVTGKNLKPQLLEIRQARS